MKRLIVVMVFLFCCGEVLPFTGSLGMAVAGVSGKSFSLIYSSDERGAITPCG